MEPPRSAAALVIGNELLTGKVRDANLTVLAKLLFELGIALRRVIVCPDEVETIVADLDTLRHSHDFVFTSGGVGPTHDDVTIEAVARAFGQQLERSPEIEALLRAYLGERLQERHLSMADVPQGARLLSGGRSRWPMLVVGNVFVLPGVPEIFRHKLSILREHLGGGTPFISRAVRTRSDEGELAALLDTLCRDHPEVAIGSYPQWNDGVSQVTVTFDGRVPNLVDHAVGALVAALPADQILGADEEGGPAGGSARETT